MKTLQQVLSCALLAALTALAGYTAACVYTATQTIRAIPVEIAATRAQLLQGFSAARRELLVRTERQVSALRAGALEEVSQIRETADRRIGDTLARADTALAAVTGLRQDLQPMLQHSASIAAQFDDALPLFLDCDHNPDCVFNRYVGASRGIEQAARHFGQASSDFSRAVPGMLFTWDRIGSGVAGTAGNLERLTKPHWYDRLLGYGLNGVVIYRNLNPTGNVTIQGARALSARP